MIKLIRVRVKDEWTPKDEQELEKLGKQYTKFLENYKKVIESPEITNINQLNVLQKQFEILMHRHTEMWERRLKEQKNKNN